MIRPLKRIPQDTDGENGMACLSAQRLGQLIWGQETLPLRKWASQPQDLVQV